MAAASTVPNLKVGVGISTRFRSVLLPHLNALLRMRYQDNKTVREVLSWLKEQQVTIARRNFHVFVDRVLRAMPLAIAKANGVDTGLLRAIRVRHKISTDPKGARVVTAKKPVRHDSRRRHRPLISVVKSKPVKRPVASRQPRPQAHQPDQLPLVGMVAGPPTPKEAPKMKGSMENPVGYADWKIVNDVATEKLSHLDRKVVTNYQGRVVNMKTKQEYTEEDLVRLYGLTPTEAQSCFMSFTRDPWK